MKTIRSLIARVMGDAALRSAVVRPRVRREPLCEMLEGRQLLSTAAGTAAPDVPLWSMGSFPVAPGSPPPAALTAHWDGSGGAHDGHAKWATDAAHGRHAGSFTPKAMSPALKADFTKLQNDEKELQSQIPASVTSAITADQAVISKAFASLASSKPSGTFPAPVSISASNASANMTAMLEKAGVSSATATTIASDFQTYQTDLKTVDPALQAQISADVAAIAKDGGPSLPAGAAVNVNPGGPMMPFGVGGSLHRGGAMVEVPSS